MLVSALVAGFVSSGTPAYAAPEEVLQSVEVALGADGTIGSVTSTSVHQVGEDARRESQGFDPTEAADELPVRVLTSYRLGDRAGTDLTDIEGESGRVVIEVTVQNTTVGAQELTFDSNGVQRSEYALVGTPLTVVASADLGADSMDQVVTADDVAPEVITNGVLSRGDDAAAQVQWATMLAPPRLGASTTFRLVLDAEDFTVPRFDLSVQPGLVADTSVRRLLEAAFSDDAGSTVSMESRTLELISDVNAVLAEAGGVLGSIEAELGTTADTLGARTISDLQSSSTQVTSSMASLAADLDALSNDMGQRLREGNDSALAALRGSVDDVKALLGDPARTRPASVPAADGCGAPPPPKGRDGTIYQRITQISGQLDALADASDLCREVIQSELRKAVGSLSGDCGDPSSAICVLREASADLLAQVDSVSAAQTALDTAIASAPLAQVGTGLTDVLTQVGQLQLLADEITGLGGGGSGENVLDDLLDELESLQEDLAPGSELRTDIAALNGLAAQGLEELGTAQSTRSAAAEAAIAACQALPDDADATLREQVEEVVALTAGTDCASADLPGNQQDLVGDLGAVGDTLTDIQQRTAALETPGPDNVLAALDELQGQVGALITDVEDLVTDGGNGNLRQSIQDLVREVDGLSGGPLDQTVCPPSGGDDVPVDELQRRFIQLSCTFEGSFSGVEDAITGSQQDLRDAAAGVDDGAAQVDDARQKASNRVGTAVDELGDDLSGTADRVLGDGRRVVNTQRAALDAEVSEVGLELDGGVTSAVQAIEGDVAASNRNLRASERLLLADLRKVLVDLGDRSNNGTGLLGALVSGATRTGVADRQITTASRTAAAFGSVRAQDLGELFLQQAQLARGLELQQEFPVFGLDLPSGSSHVTVFSFRLEGA